MRAWAFDALAEHPETVAAFLCPRVRGLVLSGGGARSSSRLRYLTLPRVLARALSAPFRRGRHFDPETAQPRWEQSDRERWEEKAKREKEEKEKKSLARGVAFSGFAAALLAVLVTSGGGGGGGSF